jgi:hypothetical protein
VKRGSFKASQLQPGHQAAAAAAAAAGHQTDEEDGGGLMCSGFNAPAPPLVGAADGGERLRGTLPEGMYFIGVGVFMMQAI